MSYLDRYMMARAAMGGDARVMRSVGDAQAAILSVLLDETHDLNAFQREGLLLALSELSGQLGQRANFIEDEMLGRGES